MPRAASLREDIMKSRIKLVIFDLDDTLTKGPTIWEYIHEEMGTWESHGIKYYEEFLAGKFGYNAFIRKDVACWKGLPLSNVRKAIKRMQYIPELKKTIRKLSKLGIDTALVSSSIEIFARYVEKKFGIKHVYANPLRTKDGRLAGKVELLVPGKGKGRITRYIKRSLGLKKREILAVGDSTYDLPMFKEAGICVTFDDAADAVKKHADHVVRKDHIYKLLSIVTKGDQKCL